MVEPLMPKPKTSSNHKPRRVAISLELDWGFKRHLDIFAGCQRYADKAGWSCFIDPAPELLLKNCPGERAYDGILARSTSRLAQAASRHGVPIVNVWLNSPARKLPGVFADLATSGTMAAEHLLRRGFRSFGYFGVLRDRAADLQLKSFRTKIEQAGFGCNIHKSVRSVADGSSLQHWNEFMKQLAAWVDTWKPPIGILAHQDIYCRYLINACRSKGLHISHDVGIIGCHNETAICEAPEPSISSIDFGYATVGYQAAALLDSLMDGKKPPREPIIIPPAELIPRQTTDSFAVDDPLVAKALRFISENCHRKIQVKHVADAVSQTRRTLERRVRASLGIGIAEEIKRLRLEHAKRRMVETTASFKTIARESGFRTADHLYKVFCQVEGHSPTKYRKLRQQLFPQKITGLES